MPRIEENQAVADSVGGVLAVSAISDFEDVFKMRQEAFVVELIMVYYVKITD